MAEYAHCRKEVQQDDSLTSHNAGAIHLVIERNKQFSRIFSVANVITLLRLALIPFILYWLNSGNYVSAAIGFSCAALSDAVDGFLARTLSLRTYLGAILDPLADKLLLMSIFASLTWLEQVPIWLTSCIIGRDLLIMGGVGWALVKKTNISIAPILISKINTGVELTLASLIFLRLTAVFSMPILEQSLYALVLITLGLSTLAYARAAAKLPRRSPCP